MLPDGAEWLSGERQAAVFAARVLRFSLGWWRERVGEGKKRRFGIDVGERADGSDDQEWELGPRAGGVEGHGLVRTPSTQGDTDRSAALAPQTDAELMPLAQPQSFQRFRSLRGPVTHVHGVSGRLYDVDEEHEDEYELDEMHLQNSDGRRVRWASKDDVRVIDSQSEDASSLYSGNGYGHAPTSFRRRSEEQHGLGVNLDGEA